MTNQSNNLRTSSASAVILAWEQNIFISCLVQPESDYELCWFWSCVTWRRCEYQTWTSFQRRGVGVRLYEDLVEPGVCFDGQWCPVLAVLKTSFQAGAVTITHCQSVHRSHSPRWPFTFTTTYKVGLGDKLDCPRGFLAQCNSCLVPGATWVLKLQIKSGGNRSLSEV